MQTKQIRKQMLIGLGLAVLLLGGGWRSLRPTPVAAASRAAVLACTNNPIVTTAADSGAGSLRQAITDACAGSTITFAGNVTGTITLTSGELVINKNLTITGPGANQLTISGNNASRVFFINPGAPGATTGPPATNPVVSLSLLKIANGKAKGGNGGGGECGGGGGGAAGMGGALFINGGTVTIADLSFDSNQAIGGNGGERNGNGYCGGGGGGGVGGDGATASSGLGGNGGSLGGTATSPGVPGSNGGEGAGGGAVSLNAANAGSGGFGGGGAGAYIGLAGNGGFGGGSGGSGNRGASGGTFGGSGTVKGGGGAGLGGAIFIRAGSLAVTNSSFTNNSATGGTGSNSGQGKGGALFIHMGATVTELCPNNATFSGNTATDAMGSGTDTNDVYGNLTNTSCNTAPTLNAMTVTRTAGAGASNSQIATVNDAEDAANTLVLQISSDGGLTFGNTATLNGVTVILNDSNAGATGTNPDGMGQVFADVVAACGGMGATFKLRVVDSGGLLDTQDFAVGVTSVQPMTSALLNQLVCETGTAMFSTTASGIGPFMFVWKKGATVINAGIVNTPTTSTLTLSNVPLSATGTYSVEVTENCNTVSSSATLTVKGANPVVTTTSDSGPGSLRQAIEDACVGSTIIFNLPANSMITLTSGELVINKHLTIQGPGANLLTVSGNNQSRVFHIAEDFVNVTLSGLTIANGYQKTPDVVSSAQFVQAEFAYGGGLYTQSSGTVNLTNCVLTGNRVQGGNATGSNSVNVTAGIGYGGAVAQRGNGTLNINGCRFSNNRAFTGTAAGGSNFNLAFPSEGGAVYSDAALNLNQCTLSGNSAGRGGAISNRGSMTLAAGTVAANEAVKELGGGIYDQGTASAIINTTVSGNRAEQEAGGIFSRSVSRAITNCTITDNHGGQFSFGGGGLFGNINPPLQLKNTIIAGNTGSSSPDVKDLVNSLGNNLIGDGTGATGLGNGVNNDQVGNSAAPLDPKLGPLANNGGPTLTHRLLPGSPALNAGTSTDAPATDQRGVARPQNGAVDIGAVEASFTLAATSGTPQTTIPGTPFVAPLLATLTENGFPFANVPLTFSAPVNGASASFPGGATVNTNAQGQASASAVANLVQGSYAVQATATGLTPASFALTNACPTLTLAPLPQATAGVLFNAVLSASPAGGNYQFSSANLPAWLTLTSGGGLSGTSPTAGTFTFNVTVVGFGVCTQTLPVTLTVVCPTITLAPATLPSGVQGAAYNQTVSATPGGTTYSYAVTTNVLPPGLTLNNATGVISGTPTAAGNYVFAVTASGWGGCSKTQSYNLLITSTCATITVNPALLPGGTLGVAYSQQTLAATGGTGPYTFSVASGALPAGLSLDANTGVISGTPLAGGLFTPTIRATSQGGCTGQRTFALNIACVALTINPATLPPVTAGVAYSQQLTANVAGTFSLQLGSLPPGLNLTSAGLISGVTTQTGSYNLTVKVTAGTCTGTRAYTLVVGGASLRTALAQQADYDGDGKADLTLWSPGTGVWTIARSSEQQSSTHSWGAAGDATLLGDYDGDGKTDLAVFRPSLTGGGTWYVKRSSDGGVLVKSWGQDGDVPVPGDYDGDGVTDMAVWRGATGTWYVWRSSDQQYEVTAWGTSAAPYHDLAVPGDYDGDGKTDLAVFRRATGTWLIKRSSDGQYLAKSWGLGTDTPVAADYDGDGVTDLAVWRGSTWYIWQSAAQTARVLEWGAQAAPYHDQARPDDYDGDGQADVAVWRAAEQTWYVRGSADGRTLTRVQAGAVAVNAVPR